jgi:2'-5' RNA ligase
VAQNERQIEVTGQGEEMADDLDTVAQAASDSMQFADLKHLTNHWARRLAPRSYYWFLTFEDQPRLHGMVAKCQEAITSPHFDPVAASALHMTLERIDFEAELRAESLAAVVRAVSQACQLIPPLGFTVGRLGGTSGAVGFSAYPDRSLQALRLALRAATLTAHPTAKVRPSEFHPHITIAYCNTAGIPAGPTIASVDALSEESTEVRVGEVTLVLLQRNPRAYVWQAVERIPLRIKGR